jgi:ribosomal protein S27E
MNDQDLRVDGNAVAGLFSEVFALELSAARVRCAGCGQVAEIGAEPVYAQAAGTVLRCRGCDDVLLVVVHGGGHYRLGTPGASWIEIPEGAPLH